MILAPACKACVAAHGLRSHGAARAGHTWG